MAMGHGVITRTKLLLNLEMQIAKAELSPSEMAEVEAVTTIYREDKTVQNKKWSRPFGETRPLFVL